MRIEVTIRVSKPEGYGSDTVAESSRTLIVDDDYRTARRTLGDVANDTVAEAQSRLRHLENLEAEQADAGFPEL